MSRMIREAFTKAALKAATNLEIETSHLNFSFDPDLTWTDRITNMLSVKADDLFEDHLRMMIREIVRYFKWNVEGDIETTVAQADVHTTIRPLGSWTYSIVVYPK